MKYLFYFLLFQTIALAQVKSIYADVEKTMQAIPESQKKSSKDIANYIKGKFSSEESQIKAAYYYVISTVSYDVNHEFTVNLVISDDEMVSKTIATKKGVCIHYAKFFKDIVTQLGYNCQVISGYTKKDNILADQSHAWNAIKMKDGNWYVFDPTWDSGFKQNGKFVRRLSSKYYKTKPLLMLQSHMPFDYMWQFLNYPISEQNFIDGNFQQDKNQQVFDYDESIKTFLTLSENEQLAGLKERMIQTGYKNKLAKERFEILKKQLEVYSLNANVKELNIITNKYNEGIKLLNDFIYYRNAQFRPLKEDKEILEMIQNPLDIFEECSDKVYKLGFVGQDNLYDLNKFKRGLIDVIEQTKTHKAFVNDYLTKSDRERKKMFLVKK
ncbi:transglutaminase domain-containing protein [uncultured Flavobacterium sp.]|uniref:transglutaminase domain-containing protein n=1 Tax=uncultured Flavobacterium sp. TaxID=165435 RepID=UPI0030C7C6F6